MVGFPKFMPISTKYYKIKRRFKNYINFIVLACWRTQPKWYLKAYIYHQEIFISFFLWKLTYNWNALRILSSLCFVFVVIIFPHFSNVVCVLEAKPRVSCVLDWLFTTGPHPQPSGIIFKLLFVAHLKLQMN